MEKIKKENCKAVEENQKKKEDEEKLRFDVPEWIKALRENI